MTQLTERDRSLVRFLIEALDDDGYLSAPLQELWETLPPEYEGRAAVKDLVDRLMGRNPEHRFEFIQNRAGEVDRDLIDA